MGSLRRRILTSYVLVVLGALLLAGAVALFLLYRYQTSANLTLRHAVTAVLRDDLVDLATSREVSAEAVGRLRRQAAALGVRFLIADSAGNVLQDTDPAHSMAGQRIKLPPAATGTPIPWRRWRDGSGNLFWITSVPLERQAAAAQGQPVQRYLLLAVPSKTMLHALRDLIPPLALATLIALLVAAVAAWFLSRSIANPLRTLTVATRAVARGNYEERVPVRGNDEIGELGGSFNTMAAEVQRARQTERDFLANVTHDLRTPLTSIQGFSQALMDGAAGDPESNQKAAQIIHEEAERMGRLIGDLLELARLEANVAPLDREALDLSPWLTAIAGRFAPRARATSLTFASDVPADLPRIDADARRLEQAVENLLANAAKYTPAGGAVTLRAFKLQVRHGRPEPAPGGDLVVGQAPLRDGPWLAIQVADTGRGIPRDEAGRIFERFYRADKARSETAGSGLGLAIVREIVLAHGGAVAVRSEPGAGSTFSVLLPVA